MAALVHCRVCLPTINVTHRPMKQYIKGHICLPASISNLLKVCNTKCTLILLSNIFELTVDLMFYLCLEKVEYMLMKSIRVEEKESDVPVRDSGGIK